MQTHTPQEQYCRCDIYFFQLSEVKLHGSEQSQTFAAEVTKRPLRFAFNDGRVGHVCPSSEEPLWVVNFKKGILSNLQNSMPNFEEEKSVCFITI